MEISSRKTGFFLFDDLRNELNLLTFVVVDIYNNTRWKESQVICVIKNEGHFLLIISSLWKERNNRICFQAKDDVRMEPDGNGSDRDKTTVLELVFCHAR